VDSSLLLGATIEAIHTPACEPVHPAWVGPLTTPIATSMAVLQLAGGRYLLMAPCEAELNPGKYPSLRLELSECTEGALHWLGIDGKAYSMSALAATSEVLPFAVSALAESDPLEEGAVSEVLASSANGRSILFRHIFPPMTLGLAFADQGQAPNNSSKPTPLRGAA
jgi:hypothetical protein